MNFPTLLKTGARAAIVALTIGGTALTAMPAQAASPNLGFSFSFGNGSNYGGPGVQLNFGNSNKSKWCLTDRQLTFQLRQHGWSGLQLIRSNKFNAIFVGARKGNWYQVRVNRCDGNVDVRPVSRKKNGGGFNITLGF